MTPPVESSNDPKKWRLRPPFTWKLVLGLMVFTVVLGYTGKRTGLDKVVTTVRQIIDEMVGLREESPAGKGVRRFATMAFPMVFSESKPVDELTADEKENPPAFSYVITKQERVPDPSMRSGEALRFIEHSREYQVRPFAYLVLLFWEMLETLEMALWGTILSILLATPLAYLGAKGYSPHSTLYFLSRGMCSLMRSVPELISALFFILVFGFGPVPGILAMGLHTAGFLGKFFADEIENAPKGPQEALACLGTAQWKVLRFAVIPQVMPQYLAYMQYILERNVRAATVLGIVGAGGIGDELLDKWNLAQYGHVSTILLVIFVTVFLLEHLTQHIRRKLI
ncbi:MAG: phosphonate ABC transporter, permease protein PhnE [Gemmataceae bacterium]